MENLDLNGNVITLQLKMHITYYFLPEDSEAGSTRISRERNLKTGKTNEVSNKSQNTTLR
jgi:hypothetical protein